MNNFGLIISGRLPQTDFITVGENKLLMNVPDIESVSYIVVFLTGTTPLPDGCAAAVHFRRPNAVCAPTWQYLGHISNTKPSAIFKISQPKKLHNMEVSQTNAGVSGADEGPQDAHIGISIESEVIVSQPNPAVQAHASTAIQFAQTMLENFFNYASSLATSPRQGSAFTSETLVPLSTLQNWFTSFQNRLKHNPNFLRD